MKFVKKLLIIAAVLILLFVIVFLMSTRGRRPEPRFVAGTPSSVEVPKWIHYNWHEERPFVNGKTWIYFNSGKKGTFHCYQFDMDSRKIVGELFNGSIEFENADGTKLFCTGPEAPSTMFQNKLKALANKISGGKLFGGGTYVETFWIVDSRKNTARRLGQFGQFSGVGSRWFASPDSRYAYNLPSTITTGNEFFFCDIESGKFHKIAYNGYLWGWWDAQSILCKDNANNLVLFNVVSEKTTTLFSAEKLAGMMKEAGLTEGPKDLAAQTYWNGREFDFYFTSRNKGIAGTSYLFKVERPGPVLKLINPAFEFKWSGKFDETGNFYMYDGESGAPGKGGNGAVMLRDLRDGTVRTLVEPSESGGYALSRFYKDSVVYARKKIYWRIDLNGSNNVPAFSLPE